MKTVLITGGIASGKSVVARYLRSRGFPVYDSDSRTKELYVTVPGLRERVEEAIGVPLEEAAIIFGDPRRRRALEKVVYPEVLRDFLKWREDTGAELVFMESAVAGSKRQFRGLFDKVLLIKAPLALRLQRDPRTARRRGSQRNVSGADFVVMNDGSIEELENKIERLIHENRFI